MKTINAKNIKEAEELAVKLNLAENADFSDLDLSVVNTLLNELQKTREIFKNFPTLKFIGSHKIYYTKIKTIKKRYVKKLESACVMIHNKEKKYSLLVNERYYNSRDINNILNLYQKSIEENSLHSPINCFSVKGVIDHEIGHILDFTLNAHNDRFIKNFFRMNHDKNNPDKMAAALSLYANTSTKEFIAEVWAEYCNNPTPRNVAKSVAEHLIYLYCSEVYSHPDDIINEQKKIITAITDQRTPVAQQQEKKTTVKKNNVSKPVILIKKATTTEEIINAAKENIKITITFSENGATREELIALLNTTTKIILNSMSCELEEDCFHYGVNTPKKTMVNFLADTIIQKTKNIYTETKTADSITRFEVGKKYYFIYESYEEEGKHLSDWALITKEDTSVINGETLKILCVKFSNPNIEGKDYIVREKNGCEYVHVDSFLTLKADRTEEWAIKTLHNLEQQEKESESKTAKPVKTPKADGQQLLIDFSDSQEIITSKARTKKTRINHNYSNQLLINFDEVA